MLSRALDLLDQHLYGNLSLAADREAVQGIANAYRQLSFKPDAVDYYKGNQLEGVIKPRGEVGFKRNYPELGIQSYQSPQELIQLIQNDPDEYFLRYQDGLNTKDALNVLADYANKPQPTRELIQMSQAFNNYSKSSDGARLYYNIPASDHRAKAYERQGFQQVPKPITGGLSIYRRSPQMLDNRPGYDDPNINKIYAIGDVRNYGEPTAQALLNQRIVRANNPQLAFPINQVIKELPF